MMNDARKVFRDWINSPRHQSKLTFQLCSIGDISSSKNHDEYTIVGLNSRLKWYVGRDSADMWIDFSGIVASKDDHWDVNYGIFEGYEITTDSLYILANPSKDNVGVKYQSFAELLSTCFSFGVSLIEQFIEMHAYIYVFANVDGGSLGHIGTIVQLKRFFNKHLYKQSSKAQNNIDYPYLYFAPLAKPRQNLYKYC